MISNNFTNFTTEQIYYSIMIEEKYVYVIHYFSMRLDTGEIKDKIWLEGNHYYAKNFFNIRKDMIDRAVGKKPRISEFEKRNYYKVDIEVPGDGFDGCTFITYTLTMKRQKVRFYELKDLADSYKDSAL